MIPFDLGSMGPFEIFLGAQGSLWQEAVVDDTYHWSSIGHFSHYHLATFDCREFNGLYGCPLHPWPIDEHHRSAVYVSTRTDAQQRKSSLSFQQHHVQHLYHAHVLVMQSAHFDNGLAPWVSAVGGYTLDSCCCHCLSQSLPVALRNHREPSPVAKSGEGISAMTSEEQRAMVLCLIFILVPCKIVGYRTHVCCCVMFESYMTYPLRIREEEPKPM